MIVMRGASLSLSYLALFPFGTKSSAYSIRSPSLDRVRPIRPRRRTPRTVQQLHHLRRRCHLVRRKYLFSLLCIPRFEPLTAQSRAFSHIVVGDLGSVAATVPVRLTRALAFSQLLSRADLSSHLPLPRMLAHEALIASTNRWREKRGAPPLTLADIKGSSS